MDNLKSKKELKEITKRKGEKEQLRLFSQFIDSSPDGTAMGNPENRITYANEAFVRMFGYSREELIGKEIAFIYPENQIPKLKEALKTTMKGCWTGELVARRKNGELFPISVSASRIVDEEGKVIASMASHRDITEWKKAEEALKQKNLELERFNKLAISRELKMIELKKRIKRLEKQIEKLKSV